MMTDAELASILAPSQNQRQPVAALQRGLAVADSADGEVRVRVPGYVLADTDDVADRGVVTIPTLGGIQAGSVVNILTYGELGSAHQLLALGSIGATDDLVAAVAAAQQTADDAYALADAAATQTDLDSLTQRVTNQIQFYVLDSITRWNTGSKWEPQVASNVSSILLDGLVVTSGSLIANRVALFIGHLQFSYSKSAVDAAWTFRTLARVNNWKFVGTQFPVISATQALMSDAAIPYVDTIDGSHYLRFGHAGQMAAATGAVHSNIITYCTYDPL